MLDINKFFDFNKYPFEHEKLFHREGINNVVDVLNHIGDYCDEWLESVGGQSTFSVDCNRQFLSIENPIVFSPDRIIGENSGNSIFIKKNAKIIGGTFDISKGSIFIDENSDVQGAWLCGPTIIGKNTTVRPGAYIRGNVIIGNNSTMRGELKNTVVMDECDFPHPSYLGDSICGYKTHFGNQATAANVNIFGGKKSIKIKINGEAFDTGRRKIGIIMGDFTQVGCNSVSDPGTFLLPNTIVYSLTRINAGVYGPDEILKNKPMEHGIVERTKMEKR